MDLEDKIYFGELVIDIESKEDLEFFKTYYELDGEGYYLKVSLDGESLEISKRGYFFSDEIMPSSEYIQYLRGAKNGRND